MTPSEFAKAQLQQSIETYRTQLSLLVQICTVFVVADATTVGYGIQQKFGAALWVGLVFPVTMLLIMRLVVRLTIPVLATAVAIETNKEPEFGGLLSTFAAMTISHHFLEQLRAAALMETEPARVKALTKMKTPYLFGGSRVVRFVLYLIIAGQVVLPLLMRHSVGWALLPK